MTVLTVFLTLAFGAVSWLWLDMGRGALAAQKMQTISDMSVLSSLRITAESLQTVATHWAEFGALFGNAAADGTVDLPSEHWIVVSKKASDLKKALPGYQGRSTAVVTVVAESNGFPRERVAVVDAAGAQLGLHAERARVVDENGHALIMEGAWYSRGARDERSVHAANTTVRTREEDWNVLRSGRAQVVWDVRPDEKPNGNGGYPTTWTDAIKNNRLDPHRWAVFRAALDPQ